MSDGAAPLEHYVIVDMIERWEGSADVRVPGGSCWHCGVAIAYCVQIRHRVTGEQHEIGTTCAEKVGLDVTAIKKRISQMRASERAEAERQWRRTHAPVEPPPPSHGTFRCFEDTGCRCLECIDAAIRARPDEYSIASRESVIVDLATGQPVPAWVVVTDYGRRWVVRDGEAWLPLSPKRRSTHANKGYVEAEAPCLVKSWRRRLREGFERTETKVLYHLGSPLVDLWGTPIPRPEDAQKAAGR